jgi:competence protein ComEA
LLFYDLGLLPKKGVRFTMEKYKKWMILVLSLIAVGVMFYWNTKKEITVPSATPLKEEETKESKKENSSAVIDIKGAVKAEGVYELPMGARVKDAIERAGGFSAEADTAKVNLAQLIQDQMLLYIPRKGEQQALPAASQQKVAINVATKEELENITGIGPKKAESILKYREQNGPFQKIEDLLKVDGIGEKSLEKIKEQIIVP